MQTTTKQSSSISIVIPTYNRGKVLIDTIEYLLQLSILAKHIIVVDQTPTQPNNVKQQLLQWQASKIIDWITLDHPSVVAAMNVGLITADSDYVLFVDDDISPLPNLVSEYLSFVSNKRVGIVAGRVIQPWDDEEGVAENSFDHFSFNGLKSCEASYFIGCNFLVDTETAIELGGFDENFVGTAHDYEREFSDRMLDTGRRVSYCATAVVHHLKETSGGIRTYGHFLKTMKPHHAVGAYYYILRSKRVKNKITRIILRLRQRVVTRTHLKQPWWIPLTLVGDVLAIIWAIYLWGSGPSLITLKQEHHPD